MIKPTQAAPKQISFDKLTEKEKIEFENARQDCYGVEYEELKTRLMLRHYRGHDDDVETLVKYNNLFLEGFRVYIINVDDKQTEEHDEDSIYMMPYQNQKPTYYRGDIVNKIDMILYLRNGNSLDALDSYTEYIRPYYLEDIYNILQSYYITIGDYDWVTREDITKFVKKYNKNFLYVFKAFVKMKLDAVIKKYGEPNANDDYARIHFSKEDNTLFRCSKYMLDLIEEVYRGKSRFRLPSKK